MLLIQSLSLLFSLVIGLLIIGLFIIGLLRFFISFLVSSDNLCIFQNFKILSAFSIYCTLFILFLYSFIILLFL